MCGACACARTHMNKSLRHYLQVNDDSSCSPEQADQRSDLSHLLEYPPSDINQCYNFALSVLYYYCCF